MKKIMTAAALVIASGLSTNAIAAGATGTPVAFSGTKNVTNGTAGDCPMLANSVTLATSSSVFGAFSCNEQTNTIKVGACHEGGSRKASDPCAVTNSAALADGSATTPTYNYPSCTAALVGKVPTDVAPDYKMYGVGSGGGTVAAYQLGGRCNATTIIGTTLWQ